MVALASSSKVDGQVEERKRIECHELVLLGKDGKPKIRCADYESKGTSIAFLARDGQDRALLQVGDDEALFAMIGQKKLEQLMLYVNKDGPFVALRDKDSNIRVALSVDDSNGGSARLAFYHDGSVVYSIGIDAEGNPVEEGQVDKLNARRRGETK